VITGMGLVTAAGRTTSETWDAVVHGRSAVREITGFDTGRFPVHIAAEIHDYVASEYMDDKDSKRTDPMVHYAANAAAQCLTGVDLDALDRDRTGVLIGSGIGGIHTFEHQFSRYLNGGPRKVSPFFIPMMISDMASGYVSIVHGLRGPNYATVSACASGGNAVVDAWMLIKSGLADAMVTGGSEAAVTPMSLAGFCSVKALSRRNEVPWAASRPFDAERDGFVLGDGAGVILLEDLEHARARGANIVAEITGVGLTGDAYHMTSPAPKGEGAVRAMRQALVTAGLGPEDIQYINAHGTSTRMNDSSETRAIHEAFGAHAGTVAVSSTKSVTGHLLGAAAGIELIFCALAIRDSVIPPTINQDTPDPECDLDYVPNDARPMRVDSALTNSFGFGGHNVCLVLQRYDASGGA